MVKINKIILEHDVLDASMERIKWTLDSVVTRIKIIDNRAF